MGKKEFTSEELKARFSLPDPFTGKNWMEYEDATQKANKEDSWVTKSLLGLFAIMVDGAYTDEDGKERDIKELGLDTPFYILQWMAEEASAYVFRRNSVEKK